MRTYRTHTDEQIVSLVASSKSVAEVMRKIGYKVLAGGIHAHISKRIRATGADTSHFVKGTASLKGHEWTGKASPDQVLRKKAEGSHREHAYRLRRALIESGIPYRCSRCQGLPMWAGEDLVLEVDHEK